MEKSERGRLTSNRIEDLVHICSAFPLARASTRVSLKRRTVGTTQAHRVSLSVMHSTHGKGSHEVVARPLREERDRDHDPQTSPVARGPDEAQPADVRGDLAVELDRRPDLLELVLDERVFPALSLQRLHLHV